MDMSASLSGWDIALRVVMLLVAVGLPLAIADLGIRRNTNRTLAKIRQETEDRRRLQEIQDQLALEAMPEEERRRVLRIRSERQELERRAREILHAEQEAKRHG
jgi:hypothetical protein